MPIAPSPPTINWLDNTRRSIASQVPSAAPCSLEVTLRLTALLLDRLPDEPRQQMLLLLPPARREALEPVSGFRVTRYADLVAAADESLRRTGCDASGDRVASIFLWEMAHELPPELKALFADALPVELGSRMNLYASGGIEDAKVA
ncbi:MAG: hypothetical protein NDJ90_15260 [Oligoflexia bacterium]|nr:hypothetical protein [Oligoflexia bacterium]